MALRRDNNKEKQLNRAGSGRSKARGAGLYDLRYSDQDQPASTWTGQSADLYTFGEELDPTGRNRASGSSQGSYGRTEAEERPYRERHRVEVKETDYTRSRGIVRGTCLFQAGLPAGSPGVLLPGQMDIHMAALPDEEVPSGPSRGLTIRGPAMRSPLIRAAEAQAATGNTRSPLIRAAEAQAAAGNTRSPQTAGAGARTAAGNTRSPQTAGAKAQAVIWNTRSP